MKDYTELVKALRSASTISSAWEKLMLDAAAAIEALQDENKKLQEECKNLFTACSDCEYLKKMRKELEPKRGKWIWVQKANGGQYKGCSVCHAPIPTDSMLDYLGDEDCEFCYSCGAKMEVQDG